MFDYRYRPVDGRWLALWPRSEMRCGVLERLPSGGWGWWWYDIDGHWLYRPHDIECDAFDELLRRVDVEHHASFGPGGR
jgi:hypothetical protein